jgi:hypothetical protein
MKIYLLLLISILSLAGNAASYKDSVRLTKLVLTKQNKKHIYNLQQDVIVWYTDSSGSNKVKGRLLRIGPDYLVLSSLKRRSLKETIIPFNQIYAMNRARYKNKRALRNWSIALVISSTILGVLAATSNPMASSWLGILFVIPLVVMFWSIVIGLLLLLAKQTLSKNWIDAKNWQLSSE